MRLALALTPNPCQVPHMASLLTEATSAEGQHTATEEDASKMLHARHMGRYSGVVQSSQANSAQVHRDLAQLRIRILVRTLSATVPPERRRVAGAIGVVFQTCVRAAPSRQHIQDTISAPLWRGWGDGAGDKATDVLLQLRSVRLHDPAIWT